MAIFPLKKNTVKEKAPVKAVPVKVEKVETTEKKSTPTVVNSYGFLLRRPRITEKASLKAESENVYVFEIDQSANKKTTALALKELYKVYPVKIRIAPIPRKRVFVRGKWGMKSGGKKAYVYLKKGDKIDIV